MLDHINRIKSLQDQLREMGVQYDDKELVMTLLSVTKKDENAYNVHRPYKKDSSRRRGMIITTKVRFEELAIPAKRERGHSARECKNNNPSNPNKIKGSINCSEEESYDREDVDEIALLTTGNENQSVWIIDSGATQHMTYEQENLSEYVEFKRPC